MWSNFRKYNFVISIFTGVFFLAGCAMFQPSAKADKRRAEIETRQKNYEALHTAVRANTLTIDTSDSAIRDLYGEPGQVFSSGSSSGMFQIWTYEKILSTGKPEWETIRLYFNNGKLVSWSY
ncbi:MAG: hypothetical protein WC676_06540 [Candidatus Omnitrophota bacterium]